MSNPHEEEALGKAYDSRLMKRLLGYMAPYKWNVVVALALVAIADIDRPRRKPNCRLGSIVERG